jgi:hypothetical protein
MHRGNDSDAGSDTPAYNPLQHRKDQGSILNRDDLAWQQFLESLDEPGVKVERELLVGDRADLENMFDNAGDDEAKRTALQYQDRLLERMGFVVLKENKLRQEAKGKGKPPPAGIDSTLDLSDQYQGLANQKWRVAAEIDRINKGEPSPAKTEVYPAGGDRTAPQASVHNPQ